MPEIKIKHVLSFSSEDKVHKAENLTKPETYRKWKCANAGEKNATVVLQFEKATQIHSIDIGNESSAFVEVLVGRSSNSVGDYQVLLVASSFMSPLESRNGTHTNRVRMFGPEKLSQNTKDEKWDCVQIVCTQPFNKNITYGLTFIKFHSPPEKIEEQPQTNDAEKSTVKLGAFKLREDSDEDSSPPVGSWFTKQKAGVSESQSDSGGMSSSPSYAAAVLASSSNSPKVSPQITVQKRKSEEKSEEPPAKKKVPTALNKDNIVYKDVLRGSEEESKKRVESNKDLKKIATSPKVTEKDRKTSVPTPSSKPSKSDKLDTPKQKVPFNKIMDKVVFVLSGFVNPLRSEIRDKALEMGAKYKGDWDSSCTHLVCAFLGTPKYEQVKKLNGRIVKKEWILDCHKKKEPLPYRRYLLSVSKKAFDDSDDSDNDPDYKQDDDDDETPDELLDSEEDEGEKKKKASQTIYQRKENKKDEKRASKNSPRTSKDSSLSDTPKGKRTSLLDLQDQSSTPKRSKESGVSRKVETPNRDNSRSPTLLADGDGSETEDEDALEDYAADTDVEDGSNSGSDTDEEIRRIEMKIQKKKAKETVSQQMNGVKRSAEITERPDVTDLPLPDLPNLFKRKYFFLFGDFDSSNTHHLQRYITAYNGVVEDYMSNKVKYVITDKKWDKNFDDALSENEDLIFVKPTWIYKCHKAGKLMPYQPYIVIPDS